MERQEIEYALTIDDLVALGRYNDEHLPDGRKKSQMPPWTVWLMMLCGVALSAFWIYRLTQRFPESPVEIVLAVLLLSAAAVTIFGVLSYLLLRRIQRFEVQRMLLRPEFADALLPRTFNISPESFTVVVAGQSQTGPWSVVHRIAVMPEHVFLMTGPKQALILPRRAFRDENEFRAFLNAVEKYHAAAVTLPTANS